MKKHQKELFYLFIEHKVLDILQMIKIFMDLWKRSSNKVLLFVLNLHTFSWWIKI